MKQTLPARRLYSLDALRGFDMFWILGIHPIVRGLIKITGSTFWISLEGQLEHPVWNGFTFYDLIFPLFIFITGVASPYAIASQLEKGKSKQQILFRIIKRTLILVILGIIYNNGIEIKPVAEFKFASVLGRIGLAYMFANIIYLYTKQYIQIIWFFVLLLGYWLLLLFNAAPGFANGDLTIEGNFVSYVDRLLLPGKLHRITYDPVGLLSTMPAIGNALLGILAGKLLKDSPLPQTKKALLLAITGILFLIIAQLWNPVFPINKTLWTSSFVMRTGGLSLLLLSLFYYVIDVLGYKKWAFFFTVIGVNSILIYMSDRFIKWEYTTSALFKWTEQLIGEPYGIIMIPIFIVLLKWAFLYFLYLKKIFLRV